MSRAVDRILRPSLMALAIAVAAPLASPVLFAAEQSAQRAYDLPSAPLATTLNQIASQAGITLAIDPALVSGRTSAPVSGQYDGLGALQAALRGTGLQLQQSSVGSYSLVATPEGTLALPETAINATSNYESAWGPVEGYTATRTAAGTKTDTAIAELPRSVSVITRQQMEDRPVLSLNDALRYTAGVQSSGYGSDSRSDWLLVRGFEPTQFLDGLPLPKGNYATPKIEPWNLERIAVLRGPASSVYGQTPPGGLLDMTSRRPQLESSHEVEAQVGSNNHKQINFDSTGKLDDAGQFLYRVSGTVRDSGAPVDHIPDKRYNIAPSLTWNINDDTKLTFISQYTRDDTGITGQFLPLQGTKLDSPAGKISHHKNLGDPDWESYDRTYYHLGYAFETRLNDTWQFRQNLRYARNELASRPGRSCQRRWHRATHRRYRRGGHLPVRPGQQLPGRLPDRSGCPYPAAGSRPPALGQQCPLALGLGWCATEQYPQPNLRSGFLERSVLRHVRLRPENPADRPVYPGSDGSGQLAPDPWWP